ncbi:heme-degrading domain-containing protein [Aliirhizobium terrae]|uniref:heme-degrading domain-containing protein n=1 Tax=Terrirhizobium terrae TaxID=2926709 RepID=UPI002577C8A1|nr:heme-degrading domain-containing protein [Rhizobium sp. CC-CFT758]WJH40088.1 heme-degrading domain-containing protein [Rhizobium sp. CC-CFT758]
MSLEQDIELIARQEGTLVFDAFDASTAWQLGCALQALARTRGLPVVIDISLHSMPVFYAAMPGSTPDNPRWVRRKRNVVLHFLQSSYAVGRRLALQDATLESKFALPDAEYAAHGGSFPITVKGAGCIGAVTVSGLPQRDDHNLVVEALASVLGYEERELALPQ